jgi:hypothetical protein
MSAEAGVLILHGIGSQKPDFADAFIGALKGKLARGGVAAGRVAFQPVFWANVLEPAETTLLSLLDEGGRMDWRSLRMFVIQTLADAVAYRRSYPKGWDAYHQIHWEVFEALNTLGARIGKADAPLFVVAHSLGSVIFSDHVWDEQKGHGFGRDAFTRCETLAGIVTMGSNIPLFTLGLSDVRCIQFPPLQGSDAAEGRGPARWRNYFDRDDVLGYPLRQLSESYAAAVEADIEMNVGGLVTSWNPASHNGYWKNRRFIAAVAEQLERTIKST